MKPVLATLTALLLAGAASANMTVTGTGKVTYVPDVVHVTTNVSSDAKTAAEAWQKNREIVQKLFGVLKDYKIDPKDMKTTGLNLTPKYVHHKGKEPLLVGYVASYDLSVTVRNLDDVGKVLDAFIENGVNRGVGISFAASDPEKLMEQARAKAVAEARKKAETYVTGAGGTLGHVLSITEGHVAPPRHLRFVQLQPADAKALPIAPGEQDLSVTVTVVYAIN